MAADGFDPDDLARVADGLAASLEDELGPVTIADGPARVGHGLDTYVYGFQLRGEGLGADWERPLILRVYPADRQKAKARREASVKAFLADAGYPAGRYWWRERRARWGCRS